MPVSALTKWKGSVTLVTFFLLVHLLKTSCHFCLWQLQAVHAPTLNDCQSVLSGLCKKLKSIKQGAIVPRIIVKTSFPLPHGSAKSTPLPLAKWWHNLYTHNLKLHSSWLSYQMGSLDQIKGIVFLLTVHHRFLLKSSIVLQNWERRQVNALSSGIRRTHLCHQILCLGAFGFYKTCYTKMLFLLGENTSFEKTK